VAIWQIFAIPKLPPEKADETMQAEGDASAKRLNGRVVGLCVHAFLYFILMCVVVNLISIFVQGENIGTSLETGYASSAMTVSNFLISTFAFTALLLVFKRNMLVGSFLLLAVSYFLFSQAQGMSAIMVAGIVVGIATAMTQPFLMTEVTRVVGRGAATLAVSVMCAVIFLGQFISAYFLTLLNSITGENLRMDFIITAVCCVACAVFALIYSLATRKADLADAAAVKAEAEQA